MKHKTTITAKIGKYLKYQREKKGMSLSEFAKRTSLDTSFIHRVEKGYYQSVSFDATQKIAQGLGMSLDDFLVKCEITPARFALPTFEYYCKEQFQFPDAAISDLNLFISFLQEKYKKEITKMKKKHQQYWKKKTSQR